MSSTTKSIYNALKQKYRTEFPNGTPFIVACGKGRVEDVEAMIRGASAAGEDIKAMVNQKVNTWFKYNTINGSCKV